MTTGIFTPAIEGDIGFQEDIKQFSDLFTGQRDGGAVTLGVAALAAPGSAPGITTQAGAITGTGYEWGVYWITGIQSKNQSSVIVNNIVGRTNSVNLSSPQSLSSKQATVSITGITVPPGVIGWGVCRNKSAGGTFYLVPGTEQFLSVGGTLPATVVDNVVDASLVTVIAANSTGTTFSVPGGLTGPISTSGLITTGGGIAGSGLFGTSLPPPADGRIFWLNLGTENITEPFISDGTHWFSRVFTFGTVPQVSQTDVTTPTFIGYCGTMNFLDYYNASLGAQFRVMGYVQGSSGHDVHLQAGLDGSGSISASDVGGVLGGSTAEGIIGPWSADNYNAPAGGLMVYACRTSGGGGITTTVFNATVQVRFVG